MAYEQRDNSGTIFNNDRKESENHPDRTGKAMIGGVMYWVSGWIKEGAKGKFLSLAFKPMEESGQEDQTQRQPAKKAAPTQRQWKSPPPDPNDSEAPPF